MSARARSGSPPERVRVRVRGGVQGVGFRPFVHRTAVALQLSGSVRNSSEGVLIEVEGDGDHVRQFLLRLRRDRPAGAEIQEVECTFESPHGDRNFAIHPSEDAGPPTATMPVDTAPCAACRRELFDPGNRRYRYPFLNCADCGPRASIIESLPYDRARTSMMPFTLCAACEAEFHDPGDRRFHAQPIACPACGPRLSLRHADHRTPSEDASALSEAADVLRRGGILALKGVGGFQLLVDARNPDAVAALRARKQRPEKPFALMMASLEAMRAVVRIRPAEARLLRSPEAPIVLLRRRTAKAEDWTEGVAPGAPCLGVMLPSSPLHHLLLRDIGFPVVATSGNRVDEPICTGNAEALSRLHGIADAFLLHDRAVVRRLDDSVVRLAAGQAMILRRARGYAFRPVAVPRPVPAVLAVGGHLKNAVAVGRGHEVIVGPHIGDLGTAEARASFEHATRELPRISGVAPVVVAHDGHPDYASSRHAARTGLPTRVVQHHWAHVLACLAENGVDAPALGVAWDGTGIGADGTIWGGEFLVEDGDSFARIAHLRTFRLPGGEAAVREPRRSALGLFFALREPAPDACQPDQSPVLQRMLERGLHSPRTSSAGRLFDGVAAVLGLRRIATYEGQAAMELEAMADPRVRGAYPFVLRDGEPAVLDWEPTLRALMTDREAGTPLRAIAAKFHHTLVEMIVAVAHRAGRPHVALTGGCFQNTFLLERAVDRLRAAGFLPCWHRLVPPNDGGLALGQVMAVARQDNIPKEAAPHVPGHSR